ncbi:MAG: dihydroorotate dehydrogenase electron transfer subunit, partial [Bacteroidetes bacterium]|nr:dihydroorotate dehydrogenase electron transfer subunit [Bacteroidota bacterium]
MYLKKFRITGINYINPSSFNLQFYSPEIASTSLPGQFINIKIDETSVPLLRRPFSVYNINDNEVEIVFAVSGIGTKKLHQKKIGEYLDV